MFTALFLLAVGVVEHTFAQFNDDFSENDLSSNPRWLTSDAAGTGMDFQVAGGELQSSGPDAAATIWISTATVPDLSGGKTIWTFKARYAAAPSGSNNIEIFLASKQDDLSASPEGYFVRLGETGSDDGIDLFKTNSATPLISDPVTSIANGVDVSIRVTRDAAGLWTLEADRSGGTSFVAIGNVIDKEFITGRYFGIKVEHTSARGQDFYFDDISLTHVDNVPPSPMHVEPGSDTNLAITFSEKVDKTTAEILEYYLIDKAIGNPVAAVVDDIDPHIVHLTFSTPLSNGVNYELSIKTVEDPAGNAISSSSIEFFYFKEEKAVAKDVIFNEIFSDPDPPNDLPEVEFIEIYNNSNKFFNLSGWTFSDQATAGKLTSGVLGPNELVILCPASAASAFEPFGKVLGLSVWPTLNNAGDFLTLLDNAGDTIDAVQYSNSWYKDVDKAGGGWAMELINPNNTCNDGQNWIASAATQGGTPGEKNSEFNENADSAPPVLLSASAQGNMSVKLGFSEKLNSASVAGALFAIDGSLSVSSVHLSGESQLLLGLNTTIERNRIYSISAQGLTDCSGNLVVDSAINFIRVEDIAVHPKDIIINEIFPAPDGEGSLPNAEFIELFNNSDKILNLEGWSFSDAATSGTFTELILFPGEYAIICEKEAEFKLFGKAFGLSSWPGLNNSGDRLILKDKRGLLIDSVNYATTWYNSSAKAAGGWALELIDPANLCSDESNWAASEHTSGGTPGKENSVRSERPDLTGPELLEVIGFRADYVSARFNEILNPAFAAQISNYDIQPAVSILDVNVDNNLREVHLKLAGDLLPATKYTFTVSGLSDCSGNFIGAALNSSPFYLLEEGDSSDIIINEVLFNPRSGGIDFVELYNRSTKFINLNHWFLANGAFSEGQVKAITEKNIVLQPSNYIGIATDPIKIKEEYPFSAEGSFIAAKALPAYGNAEGTVVLLRSDSSLMDRFNYSEEYHFDLLKNKKGVSLERISFTEPTNNPDNWKSAASTVGFATPGYLNSQSVETVKAVAGGISTFPKIIIPDGSGQNDFTTISYSFNQSGFVASATVVDVYGRTVKSLSKNDYLPAEGFYTWDGTDDNGRKVRTGYYLVYFEIFDLDGKTSSFKEKVVVGTRF